MKNLNLLKKSAFLGTALALSTSSLLQNPSAYAAPSPITVAVIKVSWVAVSPLASVPKPICLLTNPPGFDSTIFPPPQSCAELSRKFTLSTSVPIFKLRVAGVPLAIPSELVNAIKEQDTTIVALEARIKALEDK